MCEWQVSEVATSQIVQYTVRKRNFTISANSATGPLEAVASLLLYRYITFNYIV